MSNRFSAYSQRPRYQHPISRADTVGLPEINIGKTSQSSSSVTAKVGFSHSSANSLAGQLAHQTNQVGNIDLASRIEEDKSPRQVGNFYDELVRRPVIDVLSGLGQFFNLDLWLEQFNLATSKKSAHQAQARRKQFHQKWQSLSSEEQRYAQRALQEQLARKRQQEQLEILNKQKQVQQQRQANIALPSSPKKGPVGPASNRKQKAISQLQHNRQILSAPSSAN